MTAINQEAIQELKLVLDIMMPGSLASGVDAITTLCVRSASPTGIGGFLAPTPAGTAYIHGARVAVRYGVILQGNNLANLRTSVDDITEAFVGAESETLRSNGILKITQSGCDYHRLSGSEREFRLSFDLVYEYHQQPEDIEETIAEIPIHLSLDG